MFSRLSQWLSRRARSRQLTRYAISDALWTRTLSGLPFLLAWPPAERARLRETATLFIAEKEFTTAHGLALTDEMVVSIAVQASVPVLELGIAWYRGWRGVVIYPGEFLIRGETMDEDGVVHDVRQEASGEAAANGLVLLSWQDIELGSVLAEPDMQPYNVVMHEFAHKLDMLNGEADGIPAFSLRLHADSTANNGPTTSTPNTTLSPNAANAFPNDAGMPIRSCRCSIRTAPSIRRSSSRWPPRCSSSNLLHCRTRCRRSTRSCRRSTCKTRHDACWTPDDTLSKPCRDDAYRLSLSPCPAGTVRGRDGHACADARPAGTERDGATRRPIGNPAADVAGTGLDRRTACHAAGAHADL